LATIFVGENGQHYYNTVIKPHFVPENTSCTMPANIDMRIITAQRESIAADRPQLAAMLLELVDTSMESEDAVICAEILDLPCLRDDASVFDINSRTRPARKELQTLIAGCGCVSYLDDARKKSPQLNVRQPATIYPFPEIIIPDDRSSNFDAE
jgi:hypothetical protein